MRSNSAAAFSLLPALLPAVAVFLLFLFWGMGPVAAEMLINGAGATFPYPIYTKWFDAYAKINPAVKINYQSIGSGGGIRQVSEQTIDFGATDAPMTDEEMKKAKVPLLHFPTVVGAVVPVYNIPGITSDLNLTRKALSGIFLGKITRWNDPEIAKVNPGIKLPANPILVVHRSDGSGTTYVFTDFLSKADPEWKQKVGVGKALKWPVGIGGKGNEGVSGLVSQMPFSLGYVEMNYAMQNKLAMGHVENKAKKFVSPTLETVTAAAASLDVPDHFRVSITDPPGEDAYPIASYTWLLIPSTIADLQKKKVLVGFLKWMLQEGQRQAPSLHYAPLPPKIVSMEEAALAKIR